MRDEKKHGLSLLEFVQSTIKELIIAEADHRNVITSKIGLPKEIAEMAHHLSNKYSIWIANTFKNKYLETSRIFKGMDQNVKNEIMAQIKSGKPISPAILDDMKAHFRTMSGEYSYILDWLRGRNNPPIRETDRLDLSTLTFEEALNRSKKWHKELESIKGGKIEDEDGKVVITFPDGFYWIALGKSYCEKEASAMAHCGRARGKLYSLRRNQHPYVTVDLKDGMVLQIKGRANTKPKAEFHPYIIAFLLDKNIGVDRLELAESYSDFVLNDLNDEQLVKLAKEKPQLFWRSDKAIRRLPSRIVDYMLRTNPYVFVDTDQTDMWSNEQLDYIVSTVPAILAKNKRILYGLSERQIDAVLRKEPSMLSSIPWFAIGKWTPEHTGFVLSEHPDYLDNQSISSLKNFGKITESQIDWIIDNKIELFARQDPTILLSLKKEHLKRLLDKHYVNLFVHLLTSRFTKEEMEKSNIDAEIVSQLIDKISDDTSLGYQFYSRFTYLPSRSVTADNLFKILRLYPKAFLNNSMYNAFQKEPISSRAPEMIQYILDNHLKWFKYSEENPIKTVEDWPFTDRQKQFLVDKQISREIDVLENSDLSKMGFSKEQVEKLVREVPEIFDPNKQDYQKLGITQKGIEHIATNSNAISERKLEKLLGEAEFEKFYKKHPEWSDAVYFALKFDRRDALMNMRQTTGGGFKDGYVEILYDDWTDENLLGLFGDDYDLAKRIANHELDFYGYDYDWSLASESFDDLDKESIAYVKYLLKKAFSTEGRNEELESEIQKNDHDGLKSILDDPDEFSESHGYVEYDNDIVEAIKNAMTLAVEDAQATADSDEYWELFVNPIKELLGDFAWTTKKVEERVRDPKTNKYVYDETTGTFKTEKTDKTFLSFKMSYKEFLDYVVDYEKHNGTDDEYSLRLRDVIDPASVIMDAVVNQRDALEINQPYYGVHGHIDKNVLNERFVERLHEQYELSELMKKAKVVKKK